MLRKANVFEQPNPNGEDGSDKIQPEGIEQLFGPVRPEDERDGYGADDGDGKSTENKASVIPAAKEKLPMSTSKYDLVKKVADIFKAVRVSAAVSIEKLSTLVMRVVDIKAEIYGTAEAWKEEIASRINTDKELRAFIDSEPELKVKLSKLNNDANATNALLGELNARLEAALGNTEQQRLTAGKVIAEIESIGRDELIEKAKKGVEAAEKALADAKDKLEELAKKAKGFKQVVVKTNVAKLYKAAMKAAKDEAEIAIDDKKQNEKEEKVKPEDPAEAPAKAPAATAPATAPAKAPSPMDKIREQMKNKDKSKDDKKPARKPRSSWLSDDVNIVTAAPDLESILAELDAYWQEVAAELEPLVEDAEISNEDLENALSAMQEFAAGASDVAGEDAIDNEEFHSDEAPAEEAEAPAEEPAHIPAPAEQPQMQPAMSSQQLDKTAKAFPSEHDQSGNALEVVESEGKKQLVVNKADVRTKITKRVEDHLAGAFAAREAVNIDFGDYIATGVIAGYVGDGTYSVKMEDGRTLEVPHASIFSASSKLWE